MGMFDILRKGRAGISRSRYEKHARDLMEKAGEALADGDDYRAAWLYQLLARLALRMRDYDQCLDYLMHGVECSERTGKDFNTGWLYRIASHAALEKKDFQKAVQYAIKAVGYFQKARCIYAVQWSYNLAARASEQEGDIYSAIEYYTRSQGIEGDKEIGKKLRGLRNRIPHPLVRVSCNTERVREGEACRVTARVENPGKLVLRGVVLADREGRALEKIDRLYPGEAREFSYDCTGRLGVVHSRYRKVLWRGPGGVMERDIEKTGVRVVPNIRVSITINPEMRLGRPSDMVVMIKNKSSRPVFNVRFHMDFPREMRVKPETREGFDRMLPGDEKGIVYTLIPTVVGEIIKRDVGIEYRDEEGNEYKEGITPVVFRKSLKEEPLLVKTESEVESVLGPEGLKHLERAGKKRSYIQGLITASPISEAEYMALEGRLDSCSHGFSLGGVGIDTISSHILEECRSFTLIGMREFRNERLFLFSGRSRTEERAWLLTVAVKRDGDIFNVLFKAYSDRKEGLEEFLSTVSDIVKYTIITMNFAKEVEKIEVKKVINIIDSIVQRSDIGSGPGELKSRTITVRDSVVQRSGV